MAGTTEVLLDVVLVYQYKRERSQGAGCACFAGLFDDDDVMYSLDTCHEVCKVLRKMDWSVVALQNNINHQLHSLHGDQTV